MLDTTNSQLASISVRLAALNKAIKDSHLAALDQLVLISQVDNAEQRQGNLYDQKATTQQQLAFAKNVESAKVITGRALAEGVGALPPQLAADRRADRSDPRRDRGDRRRHARPPGVKITFIVPAFNEAATIGEVLTRVARARDSTRR